MDPVAIGVVCVILLGVAILLSVHVGVALAALSFIGVWWVRGDINIAIKLMSNSAFSSLSAYIFGVIPLFVLMGLFASLSGVTNDLMRALNILVGRVRGGMSMATIFGNAIFAAVTGVSIASIAIFSKISYPPMRELGYEKRFALGTIAGSSVLGMLIPPSVLFIIYGLLAEEAIGRLFIAGILPGLLLTSIYATGVWIMVYRRPEIAPLALKVEQPKGMELAKIMIRPWSIAVLILVVLGGMYGGFFTPTEAGGMGAFGALLIALSRRQVTPSTLWRVLLETGYTSGGLLLLLMMASMYSRMLTMTRIADSLSKLVIGLPVPPLAIVCLLMGVIIILGCFLDSASILLVTVPLMIPIIEGLGFDKIWFGVITVVAVEIGILTPPLGLGVFAVASAVGGDVSVEDVFRGAFPFVVMMLLTLAILILFPRVSTFLPSLM